MNNITDIFRIDGRNVVITGALGLLGRSHASAVAEYGGNPILIDLNQEALDEMAYSISCEYGVKSLGFEVDITNEKDVCDNADALISKFGSIDALINNAANNPKVEQSLEKNFARLECFPLDHWSEDIAVGLTGSFLCSKYYGLMISKNEKGGKIINISSDLGVIAPDQRLYHNEELPEHLQYTKPITYSVVKSGIIGMSKYLSTYWVDKNVTCNALCPGGVENGQDEEFIKRVTDRIPQGRLAHKDEYQGTIVWMLSRATDYLNGAVIVVDGGRSAW